MLCSSQSGTAKRVRPVLALLLGSITAISICHSALAEPVSAGAMDWKVGPTMGNLGSLGTIKVPTSYKFKAADGAQTFLQDRKLPAPKGLLGVLAPGSVNWWVELRFTDRGYVAAPEKETLDPTEILNKLSTASSHQSGATKPDSTVATGPQWELKPQYDAATHTLEWAVRTQIGGSNVVVHTVRLLSRRGTVDATAVKPYRGFSDLAPLQALVKDITLNKGEGYQDYQNGDKVYGQAFASLVTLEDFTTKAGLASASGSDTAKASSHRALWAGAGVLACAAVAGGVFFARRKGQRKGRRERRAQPEAPAPRPSMMSANLAASAPTPAPIPSPEPVEAASPSVVATPQPEESRPAARRPLVMKARPAVKSTGPSFNPKTEALRNPLNGKHHNQRRRKVFDYNRYFTDLMGAVSGHTGQMESGPTNDASEEPGRPSLPSMPQVSSGPTPAPAGNVHAELLASQRDLIEEQKRLIQEQSKLIEEKSRLIAEKSQLLKLQKQLMEEKLL